MKQFVPFCGAAHLFFLEGIFFNCFMATVFTTYTEQSRFPRYFLTGCAWHVRVWPSSFLAVEPKTRSIALLGLDPAADLRCYRLCFYCMLQTRWQCTLPLSTLNLLPASNSQLLQVCLAVTTSLLGCILFLIFVTWDLGSCQLVAPLLQNTEAKPRQHCGNSFILVLLVLPSRSCTHPVCFWMEDQDSPSQCKVLSRSSKWINKWRDARNAVLELFFGQGQPILSETESQQVHSVLENKNLCALSPNFLSPPQASSSGRTSVRMASAPCKAQGITRPTWHLGATDQVLQSTSLHGGSCLSLFIKVYHELGEVREKPQALSAELQSEGQLGSCLDCLCQRHKQSEGHVPGMLKSQQKDL